MNLKKKLTSVLSLTLALCMLLSTAAAAMDSSGGSGALDDGERIYTEDQQDSAETPTQSDNSDSAAGSDSSNSEEPTEPTDSNSSSDPATEPTEEDDNAIPSPDVMAAASGWTYSSANQYIYYYLDSDGATKIAGDGYTGTKYQVLSLPEQTLTVNGTSTTLAAGYYYFQDGRWLQTYTTDEEAFYNDIVPVEHSNSQYQQSGSTYKRLMTFVNGIGTLYTGRSRVTGTRLRYKDGALFTGLALGYEKDVPNLYYYYKGNYQSSKSKSKLAKNDGFTFFDGKLYYASKATLNNKKTSPYAALFTGRSSASGTKLRYEDGVPYTGFGLGTEKVPNLYYYDKGKYQTKESEAQIKAFLDNGKIWKENGKWYVATDDTLNDKKTSPYASPLTGYRTVSGKLYKYTKGTGALYTGIYKKYYYSKGVRQTKSGWTKVGGKWYYFKDSKALTGWRYLSRNSKTYKYYFKSDGSLVEDLFSYFGKSYLSKKMLIQVNRNTHTADIRLYDSGKKSYCIAAGSFVCSTCEKSSDFKDGTYSLLSNKRRRWFTFTHPETKKTTYYQYATWIAGSDAWIHSPQYTKKGNIRSLNVGNYNKLGSNQSFYCVRFQTLYSKRVYDAVGKQGSKKVKVKLYRSDNKGPYGKITLADSTGKLPKNKTYDPTDPAI